MVAIGAALARMELQEGLLVELPNLHMAGNIRWKTEIWPATRSALAPDLFELDDVANPVHPTIEPDEVALDAADQCPALAITVLRTERKSATPVTAPSIP